MARPKAKVDAKQVESLAALGCTYVEIAAFFSVSESTIKARFSTNYTKGREGLKMRLRHAQIQAATNGNIAMLIFLGKQYLGQSDKQEVALDGKVQIVVKDDTIDSST